MKKLKYRIAAWFLGGSAHEFQGLDSDQRWRKGLCILSPEAMDAHVAVFRPSANMITHTALVSIDKLK